MKVHVRGYCPRCGIYIEDDIEEGTNYGQCPHCGYISEDFYSSFECVRG